MQQSSRNLKDKIRTCGNITRTGGIVAAASLAVVTKVYGEPVRWQHNEHIPAFSDQAFDIDQDGHDDIYFDTWTPGGVVMQMLSWQNDTVTVGSMIINPADTGGGGTVDLVTDHGYGDLIEAITPGQTSAYLNYLSDGPFFETTSPRYAGFYFYGPDSLIHNGWAELRVTELTPTEFELDVIATGYETEPYFYIFAGEPLVPVAVEESSWGRIKELYK